MPTPLRQTLTLLTLASLTLLPPLTMAQTTGPLPANPDDVQTDSAGPFWNSTAVFNVNREGTIAADFTNGFFPKVRFDVVWYDQPEHGVVTYNTECKLIQYTPSSSNSDQIDRFTVYSTDNGSNWNISTFYFDPQLSCLTFVTEVTNDTVDVNASNPLGHLYCSSGNPPVPGDGWTRFWGGVEFVSGLGEIAGGVVIGVSTGWTGVGCVAGGAVGLHGVDTAQAGIRQVWSGQEVDTVTSQLIAGAAEHGFDVDRSKSVLIGEVVDASVGMAVGIGIFTKGPKVVDKFGDVFQLSANGRLVAPGFGYIDDTVDISDDISGIILAGGIIRAGSGTNQLYNSIPEGQFDDVFPSGLPDSYSTIRPVRNAPKGPSLRGDVVLSGGRGGKNVKNLIGPPDSVVKGGPGRIFVTNDKGQVILDVTKDRIKPVAPGQGFGKKDFNVTDDFLKLIDKLHGGG